MGTELESREHSMNCLERDEQIFFMCYGLGSNGKGKFLETIRHVLGDYGQEAATATFEHGKGEAFHPTSHDW